MEKQIGNSAITVEVSDQYGRIIRIRKKKANE